MSDETKCACGHAGFEHAGKTRHGNECLGDNLACPCKGFTPPTPDPRERGEALAVAIIASEIGDAIAAHDSGENVSPETRARHVVAALRAPAPSEAVAWTLSAPMLGGVSALATFLSDSEEDAIKRASAGQPLEGWTVTPLYTHPAPARGVTVTEAMVEAGVQAMRERWEIGNPHRHHQLARAILTAALTPDAEGGA